jgi:hypothetical protein
MDLLVQKMADSIREEIDNKILSELIFMKFEIDDYVFIQKGMDLDYLFLYQIQQEFRGDVMSEYIVRNLKTGEQLKCFWSNMKLATPEDIVRWKNMQK